MRFLPVLALVATAAGCSSSPDETPAPTPVQPEPADLVVTLSSPGRTVYTNAQVTAEVHVSGGQAETVELLAGEQVIASASTPPYTFTWDTTASPEGPYTLWARATAHGKTFASNYRLAVVDRTAPVLVSQSPAENAVVEGRRASMAFTFSEPLLPSSLDVTRFRMGDDGDVSAQLSENGRRLTFQSAEDLPSPGPLYVFAFESGLTDLAGNPVGTVRSAHARLVPEWKEGYASSGSHGARAPVVVTGSGDTVYAAWAQESALVGQDAMVLVQRWSGSSWQRLGGQLNRNGIGPNVGPSLVVDSTGAPIVAFAEWAASGNDAFARVLRWDGSRWVNLGGDIDAIPGELRYVNDVALLMSGTQPVLAFTEVNAQQKRDLYVRRWNGTSWEALGGAVNTPDEDVHTGFDTHSVSLSTDGSGNLLAAWASYSSTHGALHVSRYRGGSWERLGAPVSVRGGGEVVQPSMTAGTQDSEVYVAWVEGASLVHQVHAARWSGAYWEPLGDGVSGARGQLVTHPSITLKAGKPYVAWSEYESGQNGRRIQIRGFDTTTETWQPWARPLSASQASTTSWPSAFDPWLTTDSTGNLVVAFAEETSSGEGGISFLRPE